MANERQRPAIPTDESQVPSLPTQERRFDEGEVAQILQRAANLERQKKPEKPVLSLQEIEAIAREAGLDAASVRQAVRDLEAQRREGWGARLAGMPLQRSFERVVEGEIGPEDHERLAGEIREALGALSALPLQIATLGRSLSAAAFTRGGLIDVQITPRDGRTLIRVSVNSRQLAGGIFGGLIGGIGGGLGSNVAWLAPFLLTRVVDLPVGLGVVAGAVGALGVVAGAYGLARAIFTRAAGATHQRVERLADALEADVRGQLARRAAG